jgi:uncharacterized protein with HEPN domain
MTRKIGPILQEMLAAIEGIEAAVADRSFAEFQNDWLLRHGVQRGIEIISEASRHLPQSLLANHAEVPWAQVKGIGSVLRHEYHRVSDRVIWTVVTERLLSVKLAIKAMQASLNE